MATCDTLKIRVAEPADHRDVLESAARLGSGMLPEWRTSEQVIAAERAMLRRIFSNPSADHAVLVAHIQDGRFAGFVCIHEAVDYFTEARHGYVDMLAVESSAEGRGVGAALLQAAENWACSGSLSRMALNVFSVNGRARALYERLGYAPETIRYVKLL